MAQGNIYKPRNNISNRTRSKIITYKNGYLRRFYERRSRRVKRGGLFRRYVLVANNRKWTIARRFIRPVRRYAGQRIKNSRSTIRGRPSKRLYIKSFQQKQRIRHFYGNRKESAFAAFFARSNRIQGISSESFFSRLESRLDITFYRRRLFPTLYGCRQFMQHHGVLLNSVKETFPNVQVQIGDILSIPNFAWKQLYWDLYCRAYYRRWGHYISIRRFYSRFKKKLIRLRSISARRARPSFRSAILFKKRGYTSYLKQVSKRAVSIKLLKRIKATRIVQTSRIPASSIRGHSSNFSKITSVSQKKGIKYGITSEFSIKAPKYIPSLVSETLNKNLNDKFIESVRRIRSIVLRRRYKQRLRNRFGRRFSFRKGPGFREFMHRFSRRNPQKRKWVGVSSPRTSGVLFSLFSKAAVNGSFGKRFIGRKKRALKGALSHSNLFNRKGYLLLSSLYAKYQNSYLKNFTNKKKKFEKGLANSKKYSGYTNPSFISSQLALFIQQGRAEKSFLSKLSSSSNIDESIIERLQTSNIENFRLIKSREINETGDIKKMSTLVNLNHLIDSFSDLGSNEVNLLVRKRRQLDAFLFAQKFRKLLFPKYVKTSKTPKESKFNSKINWSGRQGSFSERRQYLRRRLSRFIRRWRRRVRRNNSYPRLNPVHRYFPSYLQSDLRTLRRVKIAAAPASQVYTGFRLSPTKLYSFYKSRGF